MEYFGHSRARPFLGGHRKWIACPPNLISFFPPPRYFVLDPDLGLLLYYVNEQGMSQKPRGSLPLIGATVTPSDDVPHMFVVSAVNGELYKLRGMTPPLVSELLCLCQSQGGWLCFIEAVHVNIFVVVMMHVMYSIHKCNNTVHWITAALIGGESSGHTHNGAKCLFFSFRL